MTYEPELFTEPQWKQVLRMLMDGPKTTGDFVSTPPLGAEYRRAISELRRKGHKITATCQRKGSWIYSLERTER